MKKIIYFGKRKFVCELKQVAVKGGKITEKVFLQGNKSLKMNNGRYLMVRLTKSQHERVKINAQAKGFKTVSDYIRSLALERDKVFEERFNEMYEKLVPEESIQKKI